MKKGQLSSNRRARLKPPLRDLTAGQSPHSTDRGDSSDSTYGGLNSDNRPYNNSENFSSPVPPLNAPPLNSSREHYYSSNSIPLSTSVQSTYGLLLGDRGQKNPFEENVITMGSDSSSSSSIDGEFLRNTLDRTQRKQPARTPDRKNKPVFHHRDSDNEYRGYYSKQHQNSPTTSYNIPAMTPNYSTSHRQLSVSSRFLSMSNNSVIREPPPFNRYPIVISVGLDSPQRNLARLQASKSIHAGNGVTTSSKTKGSAGGNTSATLETPPFATSPSTTTSTSNPSSEVLSDYYGKSNQNFSPFGGYPTSSFPLKMEEKEDDDYLHNPDPEEDAKLDRWRPLEDIKFMDRRSSVGLFGFFMLLLSAAAVFVILPALTFTGAVDHKYSGSNDGRVYGGLSAYRYPQLSAIRTSLIDPDTPKSAMTRKARDGSTWDLVFSDEFNAVGRTFFDGDDQFWTAPDLHYEATKDLEWYSPDAAFTTEGTLKLRMDAFPNHDLFYKSGMVQSWNKLCYTQGVLEISANLPNYGRVTGLWPGLWTMGNLARPGYLATSDGVWPYSYEACDAGITPNQSSADGISYLIGQRLNACTCDGEDHPNQGVGRGAPEIDLIEAETDTKIGVGLASQSMQIAPFDIWYIPDYEFIEIYNLTVTTMNTYCGGPRQQALSAVSTLNTSWYEMGVDGGRFQKYAMEYLNDDETGYVTWYIGDVPTFTIYAQALHPNGNVDWRRISKEPMAIVMNLGISNNWAYIDWQMIYFPVTMSVDYVRLYQPPGSHSITCDPEDYPTYDYIQDHLNAYTNPNLTTWEGAGYSIPKHILTGNCTSSRFKLSDAEEGSEESIGT